MARRLCLSIIVAATISGCGGSDSVGGALRVCTDPTYPPAEFKRGTRYAGFDVEIANALGKAMGADTRFVETGFDGIIAAVQGGKCDVLIAAMTVTPEREKAISFVRYGNSGYALMVPKGNPEGLTSVESLAGHTVAIQVGTTQRGFLEKASEKLEAAGKAAIELRTFPKDTDAAAALAAGKVDAYFADGAPVAYYAQRNADRFEVSADNIASNPLGIGIEKGNAELRAAVQKGVDALYDSGEMARILRRWNVGWMALSP